MNLLRDIEVDGYSLTLWDTGRRNQGKHVLGYELKDGNTISIFKAEDFDVATSAACASVAIGNGSLARVVVNLFLLGNDIFWIEETS